MTMLSSCGSKYDEDTLEHVDPLDHLDREPSIVEVFSLDKIYISILFFQPPQEEENKGRYSLTQVKKIDVYSRRIFPILFFIFVFYFFIRYHAIEGALSIEYPN